jgi:Xaa-Pro aminopeptidase
VNVGLNYSSLSLELYKQLMKIIPDKEFIDVSQSINESRIIKDESELKISGRPLKLPVIHSRISAKH